MALAAHSERLHKIFLLLLSATSPGEVFAARNAMVRIAEEEQADIHDLAKAFGVMPVVSLRRQRPQGDRSVVLATVSQRRSAAQ